MTHNTNVSYYVLNNRPSIATTINTRIRVNTVTMKIQLRLINNTSILAVLWNTVILYELLHDFSISLYNLIWFSVSEFERKNSEF